MKKLIAYTFDPSFHSFVFICSLKDNILVLSIRRAKLNRQNYIWKSWQHRIIYYSKIKTLKNRTYMFRKFTMDFLLHFKDLSFISENEGYFVKNTSSLIFSLFHIITWWHIYVCSFIVNWLNESYDSYLTFMIVNNSISETNDPFTTKAKIHLSIHSTIIFLYSHRSIHSGKGCHSATNYVTFNQLSCMNKMEDSL